MSLSYKNKRTRGFTLVELLVTLGIILAIITVTVLSSQNYSETARLGNIAEELATNIREAQTYGNSVRSSGNNDFNKPFGVSVVIDTDTNTGYNLFTDLNTNGYYDDLYTCPINVTSECRERISFPSGYTISDICANKPNEANLCGVGGVNIVFIRPSFDAKFKFLNNGAQVFNPSSVVEVKITIKGPSGATKDVLVNTFGQIEVN